MVYKIKRFLFLNFYAFLLLCVAIIVIVVPLWKIYFWIVFIQIVAMCAFAYPGILILSHWSHKMREYDILYDQNKEKLDPRSFRWHYDEPCGRLLMYQVLQDLGYDYKTYNRTLKSLRKAFG